MKKETINAGTLLAAACLLLAAAGLTAAPAAGPDKRSPGAVLARRAMDAERQGRPGDAIRAYEELLRHDPSFGNVAAHRLVELYTAARQAPQALAWARKVAPGRPDPQAYLAGVYAGLGQLKDAEMLLRQAVAATSGCDKLTPLLWQLADVQERQGETGTALATLAAACSDTRNESLRKTSLARLAQLQARQRTQKNDPEAQP